jgi:hypothetical protein
VRYIFCFFFPFFRHERQIHPSFSPSIPSSVEPAKEGTPPEDYVYNYHRGKLAYGLILFEFNDAVKEGDGDRLFDVYKMALLLYKVGGHYKYAYVVMLYLVKVMAVLPAFSAHHMKWNRFYNKHGGKGKNISLDLRMEQLNKLLKTLWRGLGANLAEGNAQRMACSLESLEMVMDSIDKDCLLTGEDGHRSQGKPEEAVKQMVADLIEKEAFNHQPGRDGYPSFPNFPSSIFDGLDYRDLHKWMTDLLKQWQSVYK